MLTKRIFLLQLTLSLKQIKIKEINPIRRLARNNREKIRRGLEEFSANNIVVNQWSRLKRLFKLLHCILNFHGNKTYGPLTVFALSLLLLKKLLLILIFVICKLMDDLLDELIKGN
jgi:hypothetical protein